MTKLDADRFVEDVRRARSEGDGQRAVESVLERAIILWERRGQAIAARGAAAISERGVFGLARDAIHSVTNPIPRLTGAIHIYGGDFFATPRSEWDPDTLRERPFDLEAARRAFEAASERFASGR